VIWGIAAGSPEQPQVVPVPPEPFTEAHAQAALPATPREVFRLAATCVKGGCPHWRTEQPGAEGDGACSLVQRVRAGFPEVRPQQCGIRLVCRWFAQEGLAACRACPGVVTDLGELPQDQASEDQVRFF
jgi:hypothetical protein